NNFTVAGVLRDGTNPAAPQAISWVGGYDGTTSPFSLARYWIYKFDNKANVYANWTQIGETGELEAGKGFTLKGAGTSGTENLTFIGKPNNGTITNAIGADQLLLVGNPYPSALDANKFIDDNIGFIATSTTDGAIDGALYFWEHYSTNNTHNLAGYQGGYGIYNKSGGVKPSAAGVDFISGSGASSEVTPKQYIPVGQGFFVIGKSGTNGIVTFKNSQRAFVKEDNPASQTMYKKPYAPKGLSHWTDNSDDPTKKDTYKRIRLGYTIYNHAFHRQVLLAFMDDGANNEMNDGYDAFNIDDSPNDMYLLNGENELAIEGEGYFDPSASFPIGVRSDTSGKVAFVLDGMENFDKDQALFIYDQSDESYHNIKDGKYEVELPAGIINDRFSLRFTDQILGVKDPVYGSTIQVDFIRSTSILNIVNRSTDNTISSVSLFSISGKSISKWDVSEEEQANIKIPIQNMASGVYVVQLKTFKGAVSKKIIVP
ncbi:MAG TPA: T9SS type A sorting domain-containing protein, partial [Flavobacterium sp.]|nr:T9SS type A sorting domain-containing protein [Flavobacterium sp.]